MLLEEHVQMGISALACREVPRAAIHLLDTHEASAHEDFEVVADRPEPEAQASHDGSEMVPGQNEEMLVDSTPRRMVQDAPRRIGCEAEQEGGRTDHEYRRRRRS